MTIVDLVRHAQSELNLDRSVVGGRSNHCPLSPAGAQAALEQGRRWRAAGYRPDALYCTSAIRSLRTAELLSDGHWGAPVIEDGLLELSQGIAEGGQRAQWWTADAVAAMQADPLHHRLAPGGETHAEVQQRMRATLLDLATRHPGGRVLAVSHGIAMRTLAWSITGGDHEHGFRGREIDNLDVLSLAIDHSSPQVRLQAA